jgi:hypothetical protein
MLSMASAFVAAGGANETQTLAGSNTTGSADAASNTTGVIDIPVANGTTPTTTGDGNATTAENATTTGTSSSSSDMVYFTFKYGFEGATRNPTTSEIEGLMCQTNLFIQQRVRNGTRDQTIQTMATNINWVYDVDGSPEQPVSVSFLSGNFVPELQGQVEPEAILGIMQLKPEDFMDYLENYVWKVATPDSMFLNATSASSESAVGVALPVAQLATASCPSSTDNTTTPSMANATTPSMANATTPMVPSASPATAPTVGSNGTNVTSPTTTTGNVTGNVTAPSAGTPAPAPTPPPVPVGSTRQAINAKFVVTNLIGITDPTELNNSGLAAAWPPFVQQVVAATAAANNQQAQKRRLGQAQETTTTTTTTTRHQHRRRLAVELEPNTAYIYEIILKESCGADTNPDSTCHDAYGTYNILVSGDDREKPGLNQDRYGEATVDAIDTGKLQTVMEQETSGTPLFIGTVAAPGAGGGDGGMPIWLIILIILLCILFCCCLVGLFMRRPGTAANGGKKESEPYEEEGFAYDFLIPPNQQVQTEVDDDVDESAATKKLDEDELFEDDDNVDVKVAKMTAEKDEAPVAIMEGSDDEGKDKDGGHDDDDDDDEEDDDDDDDDKEIKVSAEVEDEDEDEFKDDDDDLVPLNNEVEESENLDGTDHDNADGWDDEDEQPLKKK